MTSYFGSAYFGGGYFRPGMLAGVPLPAVTPAPPPATTGTSSYAPQLVELFEEAFERAGSELRTGYDFRTARRSLNMLTIEWANRGINLWTIEQGAVALLPGVATYSIPADTIDLIDHVIRQNPGNIATQTDIAISRISVSTYSTIPNKLTRGRPIQVYINRQSGTMNPGGVQAPNITVWPVPPDATYTFVYWRMRRIQDAGTGNSLVDIPFRFLPCLVSGLAYYIAMKNPALGDRLPMLKAEYESQWQLAADEDRDRAPVRFVPRTTFYR